VSFRRCRRWRGRPAGPPTPRRRATRSRKSRRSRSRRGTGWPAAPPQPSRHIDPHLFAVICRNVTFSRSHTTSHYHSHLSTSDPSDRGGNEQRAHLPYLGYPRPPRFCHPTTVYLSLAHPRAGRGRAFPSSSRRTANDPRLRSVSFALIRRHREEGRCKATAAATSCFTLYTLLFSRVGDQIYPDYSITDRRRKQRRHVSRRKTRESTNIIIITFSLGRWTPRNWLSERAAPPARATGLSPRHRPSPSIFRRIHLPTNRLACRSGADIGYRRKTKNVETGGGHEHLAVFSSTYMLCMLRSVSVRIRRLYVYAVYAKIIDVLPNEFLHVINDKDRKTLISITLITSLRMHIIIYMKKIRINFT